MPAGGIVFSTPTATALWQTLVLYASSSIGTAPRLEPRLEQFFVLTAVLQAQSAVHSRLPNNSLPRLIIRSTSSRSQTIKRIAAPSTGCLRVSIARPYCIEPPANVG